MRPFPSGRAGALAVSLVLAAGVPARAESDKAPGTKQKLLPVALALGENAQAQAAQVAYVLESAARRSLRHEYVDPVEKFDPTGHQTRQEKAGRAADAMSFGRKAYETLEAGLGIESFDRAIGAYEESGLWDTMRGLSQAYVMRILVKWSEDVPGARKEIQKLLAIDPRAEFPADLTPPDLAAEVEKAREARQNEPKFAIDVSTTPVAARVYVDGTYRGTSPTSVRGLVGGEHYVSLVAPGYQLVQKRLVASPGATATITLVPAEKARPFLTFQERIRKSYGEPEELPAAQVLARAAGADELLVAGIARQGGKLKVDLHRVAQRDGHVLAATTLELAENDPAFAQKVDTAALAMLEKDRARGPNGEPQGIRSAIETAVKRAFEIPEDKIKLGLAIGGGALVTAGVVTGFIASGTAGELRRTAQIDPKMPQLVSAGRAQAVTADVLIGLGLVAAGTWAWMEFGKPFAQKTDLGPGAAPEKKQDEKSPDKKEEKKQRPEDWDPFASDERAPSPFSLQPFVVAVPGVASVGVGGTF